MLKQIAIFTLGLTSPILVHISQTILGYISPSQRGDVMNGLMNSFPSNAIALILFIGACFYLYFTHRKTKDNEKILTDAINELIEEIRQDRNERNKQK